MLDHQYYHMVFDPPLKMKSEEYQRAFDLLTEMGIRSTTVQTIVGRGSILSLNFEKASDAMLFKLRM